MSPIVASYLKKKAYTAAEASAVMAASTEPGLQIYQDNNTLFVSSEKTFVDYQTGPDELQRVLPWSGFISLV
jgi:hypothetical protein